MKKQKFTGTENRMIELHTKTIKIQTKTENINYENFNTILFSFQYS